MGGLSLVFDAGLQHIGELAQSGCCVRVLLVEAVNNGAQRLRPVGLLLQLHLQRRLRLAQPGVFAALHLLEVLGALLFGDQLP